MCSIDSASPRARQKHSETAKRFLDMCESLDLLKKSYKRTVPIKQSHSDYPDVRPEEDYLVTHLKHWLYYERNAHPVTKVAKTRSGTKHILCILASTDRRRQLPSPLRGALLKLPDGFWKASKVTATWIVCWIHNIRPSVTIKGWETLECSHRCLCIGDNQMDPRIFCISPACLIWESKSLNQSRGNQFCLWTCTHNECPKSLCECQRLHTPHCW